MREEVEFRIELDGGKYTYIKRLDGSQAALRYKEPWRDLTGDNLVFHMAERIRALEGWLEGKQNELGAAYAFLAECRDACGPWYEHVSAFASPGEVPPVVRAKIGELRGKLETSMRLLSELADSVKTATKAGDWKVDGACDPEALLASVDKLLEGDGVDHEAEAA